MAVPDLRGGPFFEAGGYGVLNPAVDRDFYLARQYGALYDPTFDAFESLQPDEVPSARAFIGYVAAGMARAPQAPEPDKDFVERWVGSGHNWLGAGMLAACSKVGLTAVQPFLDRRTERVAQEVYSGLYDVSVLRWADSTDPKYWFGDPTGWYHPALSRQLRTGGAVLLAASRTAS